LCAPADVHPGPPPFDLESLSLGSNGILESARIGDWSGARGTLARMSAAWRSVQSRKPPPLVAAQLTDAMGKLASAGRARSASAATRSRYALAPGSSPQPGSPATAPRPVPGTRAPRPENPTSADSPAPPPLPAQCAGHLLQ